MGSHCTDMALTRPAPSARSYLLALPDRPMKTGATPTRLRPGVCPRAWAAQAPPALARAAGDSQRQMRIVVVEDGENERGAGLDVIAEMAPNDPRRSFKKAIK